MATNLNEIGTTGLAEFSGQIAQDFLREMRGKEAYKRYNEMRLNSPVVGALLSAIEQSIRACEWYFTSDLGEEDKRLELLKESLANMRFSWNDHISECLTTLAFGFSLFEIVYERIGGKVLWRKMAFRGQDTVYKWLFDDSGGLAGVEQMSRAKTVQIPMEKLLLYRTRVERNNPEGRSILRNAWTSYYYLKHMQQIEAIGIERDIAGMPVIHLPEGYDEITDTAEAAKIVRNVRNDEQAGLVLPPGWQFELLSAGGSRQFDTDKIIGRYETRILMTCLAQFLILGMDSVGTQALSADMSEFFIMSVNAMADTIAETFSKFAVTRLLRLNGYDPNGILLEHTSAGDVDILQITDAIQKAGGLLTVTAQDEVWFRKMIGAPTLSLEEVQDARDEVQADKDARIRAMTKAMDKPEETPDEDVDDKDGYNVDKYEKRFIPAEKDIDPEIAEGMRDVMKRKLLRFFRGQQKRITQQVEELSR